MKPAEPAEPQPISLEDAQRIWTLQKQKAPLSQRDIDLLHQAAEWQMWVSHGIRLQNGKSESKPSSKLSQSLRKAAAAL
jgi:hypothetical protein